MESRTKEKAERVSTDDLPQAREHTKRIAEEREAQTTEETPGNASGGKTLEAQIKARRPFIEEDAGIEEDTEPEATTKETPSSSAPGKPLVTGNDARARPPAPPPMPTAAKQPPTTEKSLQDQIKDVKLKKAAPSTPKPIEPSIADKLSENIKQTEPSDKKPPVEGMDFEQDF